MVEGQVRGGVLDQLVNSLVGNVAAGHGSRDGGPYTVSNRRAPSLDDCEGLQQRGERWIGVSQPIDGDGEHGPVVSAELLDQLR